LIWRFAYHDAIVCASHNYDDRASMPNLIAEQRDRIVEIGVYGLPVFIDAFYPCCHRWFLPVSDALHDLARHINAVHDDSEA